MNKRLKLILVVVVAIAATTNPSQAQTRSYKRGLAYNLTSEKDIEVLAPGVSWFYNWGQKPEADKAALDANRLDFLPMAWNDQFSKADIRNYLAVNPHIKYILGFNEPNFTKEANMTPKQAAAKWHLVEEIAQEYGLKIVGPAVNYAPAGGAVKDGSTTYTDPIKYLDDFFSARPESKVDFIAVHCYMNYIGGVKDYISKFKKYGKPIWLTEHCGWEGGLTYAMQRNLLAESVLYLETDPDIYRYSWFIGRTDAANEWPHMQLLEHTRPELTELGLIYVNMSSFDADFYFQIDQVIPAQHFIDAHEWTHLEKTTDAEGTLNLYEFTKDRWVAYQVELPEPGLYNIEFRYAALASTQIKATASGQTTQHTLPKTGSFASWGNNTLQMQLPAGKQTLRIDVAQGNAKINWLKITSATPTAIGHDAKEDIPAWPNPVDDVLNITPSANMRAITLTDESGKPVYRATAPIHRIEMEQWPKGIYLLTIEYADTAARTIKIIKK